MLEKIPQHLFLDLLALKRNTTKSVEDGILVEGLRVVDAALTSSMPVSCAMMTVAFLEKHPHWRARFADMKIPLYRIRERDFARLSEVRNGQGVMLHMHIYPPEFPPPGQRFVYLEETNDPTNLATIMRTALWFGFSAIFLSPGSVAALSAKVVRASAGAVFYLPVYQNTVLSDLQAWVPTEKWYAAVPAAGKALQKRRISHNFLLLFGNESHGLSSEALRLAENQITIPGNTSAIDSLNLGISAALCMYELTRKGD
jgi:TrmH family RNA methyltransferase